jgi:hypothetical protein
LESNNSMRKDPSWPAAPVITAHLRCMTDNTLFFCDEGSVGHMGFMSVPGETDYILMLRAELDNLTDELQIMKVVKKNWIEDGRNESNGQKSYGYWQVNT